MPRHNKGGDLEGRPRSAWLFVEFRGMLVRLEHFDVMSENHIPFLEVKFPLYVGVGVERSGRVIRQADAGEDNPWLDYPLR